MPSSSEIKLRTRIKMPKKITWSTEMDEKLSTLLNKKRMTLRKAAEILGVSRSFLHRRSQAIVANERRHFCSSTREQAGGEPLAAGHPISWTAIQLSSQYGSTTAQNAGYLYI
jgi:hypothetical protein